MFDNRTQAGKLLAREFGKKIAPLKNVIVVGLPRGGIPVAFEFAKYLSLPLEIFSVKKIPAPYNPELALGAVTEQGEVFYNQELINQYGMNDDQLKNKTSEMHKKAKEQGQLLRKNHNLSNFEHKNIILIDDGIATGATIRAAIEHFRKCSANSIVLATPVCSQDIWAQIKNLVDDIFVLDIPFYFEAVGRHYRNFSQVSNKEIIDLYGNELDATAS